MALPRLLRTSSFRLTVIYAGLFGASVLLLFAIIYEATSFYMTASLDAEVDSDIMELTDSLRNGGTRSLAATIDGRVRENRNGPMYYRLTNPTGGVEAGNLPKTARRLGRFDLNLASPDANHDSKLALRARGLDLPDGAYLLVGIDAHPLDEMHELILRAFGWGSAITLVLAFGGGAVLSGGLLRRVEAIARAARDIMSGDFSRRLPMRGADDEFDHLVASLNAMLDQNSGLGRAGAPGLRRYRA